MTTAKPELIIVEIEVPVSFWTMCRTLSRMTGMDPRMVISVMILHCLEDLSAEGTDESFVAKLVETRRKLDARAHDRLPEDGDEGIPIGEVIH